MYANESVALCGLLGDTPLVSLAMRMARGMKSSKYSWMILVAKPRQKPTNRNASLSPMSSFGCRGTYRGCGVRANRMRVS